MSEIATKASLRFFTNETNVNFISEALNVTATSQHLKGELCSKRNPKSSVFKYSVWIYESSLSDSSELHEHLNELLKFLEVKQADIQAIRNRLTSMDIFCMFSSENGQGSAELEAALLKRLADTTH